MWGRAPRFAGGGSITMGVRPVPPAARRFPNSFGNLFDRIGDLIKNSFIGKVAARMKSLVDTLLSKMATMFGTGSSVVGYSAGMSNVLARLRSAGARSFTTYPGHHPSQARARDVTPHNWHLANLAKAASSVWYVIYRMRIASKNHGNNWRLYVPRNFRGDWRHVRHIHVGFYKGGGLAGVGGPQLGMLGEGGPERVLDAKQTKKFDRWVGSGDQGGGGTTTIINHYHFPHYVGSQNDIKRALVTTDRRGDLGVIKRTG
jgi:hypothetical protein